MSERFARRYETEATAIEAARRYSSVDRMRPYRVIESPHPECPDAGRFVVDTDDFLTGRERLVCVFDRGEPIND